MNKTNINWTELTWNPWSGCKAVSAGCKYCYAETLAERKRGTKAFPRGFEVTYRPHKLREPASTKEPSLIFTNSMTDMFLEEVPDAWRDEAFAAIEAAPWHRYQVLTKRPESARRYFKSRPVPDCVWLGVTVEHQRTAERIDILREIPARVRFLSVEPLIGHLDLTGRLDGIHWVIGGGESGSHLSDPHILAQRALVRRGDRKAGESLWVPREDRYHWATDLRDAVKEAGAAFWWKQWGGPRPDAGGREVDGRTWDEMPVHIPGAMPDASRHLPLLPSNTVAL